MSTFLMGWLYIAGDSAHVDIILLCEDSSEWLTLHNLINSQ